MTIADLRQWITDASFPLTLRTCGGKTYTVRGPNSLWFPADYPNKVVLTRPGKG